MDPPQSTKCMRSTSSSDDEKENTLRLFRSVYRMSYLLNPDGVDDSFSLFLKDAGENLDLVNRYLRDLKQFFEDVPNKVEGPDLLWRHFLERPTNKLEWLADVFGFTGKLDLKQRALKLAVFWKYPQLHNSSQGSIITPQMLNRMLDASSVEDARAIIEDSPEEAPTLQSASVIKKGYKSPFLKPEIILDPIMRTINDYSAMYSEKKYFAPYAALIGPSMCGKSRLLMEMANHICVIYVCLRPPDLNAFPRRSALANKMLNMGDLQIEKTYASLIAGIFRVVTKFFNNNQDEKKDDRLKQWNEYMEVMKEAEPSQERFTQDVLAEIQKMNEDKENPADEVKKAAKAMQQSTNFISQGGSSPTVLLALDEARALLQSPTDGISFFRTFRRTICLVPGTIKFFSILVDTTSHVANFSVASKFDPSARYGFSGDNRLFDPIYEICSFDVMVSPEAPQSWEELLSPQRLFNYGSPVFGAYFRDAVEDDQEPHKIIDEILKLAQFKLFGPTDNTSERIIVTRPQAFAFLGPTIQPRINGAFHINTELIASHAAHCDHISPGCDMVMSNYPSQFTLAAAALHLLRLEKEMITCIKTLTAIVQHGLDATGGAGELASRIILLQAMIVAMLSVEAENQVPLGHPVRLVEFLKALTGIKEEDKLPLGQITSEHRKDLLQNGMIFWNHFSLIMYTPTAQDLLEFMYRGMAAQCKSKQRGLDQVFGIYLKRDSGALDVKNVSFCGIQAKNQKTDIKVAEENYKWTDDFAQINISTNPYLIICMNLNSTQNNLYPLPDNGGPATRSNAKEKSTYYRRASLVFDGLNQFGCLSEGLVNALKELITVEPDFVALKNNESGKLYSKIVNPLLNK